MLLVGLGRAVSAGVPDGRFESDGKAVGVPLAVGSCGPLAAGLSQAVAGALPWVKVGGGWMQLGPGRQRIPSQRIGRGAVARFSVTNDAPGAVWSVVLLETGRVFELTLIRTRFGRTPCADAAGVRVHLVE